MHFGIFTFSFHSRYLLLILMTQLAITWMEIARRGILRNKVLAQVGLD